MNEGRRSSLIASAHVDCVEEVPSHGDGRSPIVNLTHFNRQPPIVAARGKPTRKWCVISRSRANGKKVGFTDMNVTGDTRCFNDHAGRLAVDEYCSHIQLHANPSRSYFAYKIASLSCMSYEAATISLRIRFDT